MNFLNNISIKLKLLMMAVPPLLIITFHSVLAINALFTEKENLQVTKSRILEVESLAKAIHFLQIERGLSVGFITTNGAKNGNELTDVRNKVDNALNEIKEIYAKTKGNSSVLNNLSELNQKRSSVDSLKMSAPDVGAYYTKNIVTFIDAAAIIPTQMNDKDGRNTIQAYTHLASAKESLGQIRALLNQAFNLNSINATNYSLIIGREIVYDVNNRKFETLAPKELQDFYKNNFKGEAVDKTFSMIETAKNKGLEGNFGVDATVWFTNVTASIDILRNVELELYKFVYNAMDEKMASLSAKITTALALVIFFILAGIVVSIVLTKNILNPLNSIRMGLTSFFKFLNRETTKAELINLNSKDEFGEMAKVINENISSIEKGLLADANTVANAVDTANKVKAGYLNVQINIVPNNPQLVELRNVLNEMLVGLNANIEKSLNTLKVYATNNFTSRADKASLEGEVASLIDGINNLGNEISTMLSSSLTNGLELQTEASTLKQSVELLLTSSNQQAASLEETAAAMEEMTSNVQNNVAKSNDMALMATQTDSAAKDGAVLASRTASAMTEIQSATNS
ncbi:MAG: methyl-accepting chemotaxis protein, partial [Sulfurimonas sp.]|nr:methyl-accepting chemotaxis protein [Sulfurimonas sp.]